MVFCVAQILRITRLIESSYGFPIFSYLIASEIVAKFFLSSRDDSVRVVRDGTVVFEGNIASLKHYKDDIKSAKEGFECGIGIDGFQDIKPGDTIEGFKTVEVERTE